MSKPIPPTVNVALSWAGSKRTQYTVSRSASLAVELACLPMYMLNVAFSAFFRSA